MKKLSKILMFSFLGLILGLASCDGGSNGPGEDNPGTDVESTLRTTYLVLGEGGLYKGEPGESIASLYLDNAITYVANVGDPLPTKEDVTNSDGTVLHYWVNVDGTGTEFTTYDVPNAEASVLYARYGDANGTFMRVYFKAPSDWNTAYVYAWASDEDKFSNWPGSPMARNNDGLFFFEYDTTHYPNVIFNNGNSGAGNQTSDLTSPTDPNKDCYVWNNGWYNEDTSEQPIENGGGGTPTGEKMRVYFKAPAEWSTAYIYAWKNDTENMSGWPGTVMEKDTTSGLFYYDYEVTYYPYVIFNNGNGVQTGNLTSPTDPNKDCYVWNNGWYNEDTSEEPKEAQAGTIYFKPNENWKTDGAWFAAWTWGGSTGDCWVTFTDSNGDGIYEAELAAGRTGMKFVRMNPSVNTPDWNNGKWNETGDVNVPADGKNMFTLTEDPSNWSEGTWSTYNG